MLCYWTPLLPHATQLSCQIDVVTPSPKRFTRNTPQPPYKKPPTPWNAFVPLLLRPTISEWDRWPKQSRENICVSINYEYTKWSKQILLIFKRKLPLITIHFGHFDTIDPQCVNYRLPFVFLVNAFNVRFTVWEILVF